MRGLTAKAVGRFHPVSNWINSLSRFFVACLPAGRVGAKCCGRKGKIFMVTTDLKNIYLGAVENNGDIWSVKVYLTNTSGKPKTVQQLQGSFAADIFEPVMDLGHSPYKEITIPAKAFIQIDQMNDWGELDFTTYYNIKDGENVYLEQINGWSFWKDRVIKIPIINEIGYFGGFGKCGG